MKPTKSKSKAAVKAPELSWTHCGALYRIRAWPEAQCERQLSDRWEAVEPTGEALASGALCLDELQWGRYLEYVPMVERDYLLRFRYGRLAALWVLTRCPGIAESLFEAPALTAFVAAHSGLRGTASPRWGEVEVVHERSGIFGLLDWLGLPSSRQTLAVLHRLMDPDIPQRLLEPLRTSLWEPALLKVLERTTVLTDRELARCCHPLAA